MDDNNLLKSVDSNISNITFDTDSLEEIIDKYQHIHESFLEMEDLLKLLNKPDQCGLYGSWLIDFKSSIRKYEDEIKDKIKNYDDLIDNLFNIERNYTNEINDLAIPKQN